MNVRQKEQFLKSDKSLAFMRNLLLVFTTIGIIACWVIAIILWANAEVEVPYTSYTGRTYYTTETSGAIIGYGFLVSIIGTFLLILAYNIAMFFIWLAYDVKVIRNAVTNTEWSDGLKYFTLNQEESWGEDNKPLNG